MKYRAVSSQADQTGTVDKDPNDTAQEDEQAEHVLQNRVLIRRRRRSGHYFDNLGGIKM